MGNSVFGERVGAGHFGLMEWIDYEKSIDRLNVNTFLGRWKAGGDGKSDRIVFCCQNDDGDVCVLGDDSGDDEPMRPSWRLATEPDQILVPVRQWGKPSAIDDVFLERLRQVADEGWSAEHDDLHTTGDLARLAALYAGGDELVWLRPNYWPDCREWFKPKDRRRDLVRAGALIIAEIERLDRLAAEAKGEASAGAQATSARGSAGEAGRPNGEQGA